VRPTTTTSTSRLLGRSRVRFPLVIVSAFRLGWTSRLILPTSRDRAGFPDVLGLEIAPRRPGDPGAQRRRARGQLTDCRRPGPDGDALVAATRARPDGAGRRLRAGVLSPTSAGVSAPCTRSAGLVLIVPARSGDARGKAEIPRGRPHVPAGCPSRCGPRSPPSCRRPIIVGTPAVDIGAGSGPARGPASTSWTYRCTRGRDLRSTAAASAAPTGWCGHDARRRHRGRPRRRTPPIAEACDAGRSDEVSLVVTKSSRRPTSACWPGSASPTSVRTVTRRPRPRRPRPATSACAGISSAPCRATRRPRSRGTPTWSSPSTGRSQGAVEGRPRTPCARLSGAGESTSTRARSGRAAHRRRRVLAAQAAAAAAAAGRWRWHCREDPPRRETRPAGRPAGWTLRDLVSAG
jgi:hypothetical protein